METLGATIKESRKVRRLTLVELGKAISLSQGYLSNIENDNKIPSPEVLKKIADTLDCDYMDLMIKAGLIPAENKVLRAAIDDFELEDPNFIENYNREEVLKLITNLKSYLSSYVEGGLAKQLTPYYGKYPLTVDDCQRILLMLITLFPEYQEDKE